MPRPRARTWLLIAVVFAVAVFLAGGFFALRWTGGQGSGVAADTPQAGTPALPADRDVASAPRPPAAASAADPDAPGSEKATAMERFDDHGAIRRFKELTRYPGSSRRLTAASVDLLQPNKRHERRQPVADPDDEDARWEVRFTADRYFVRGREPVAISLSLWRDGEPVRPRRVALTATASHAGAPARAVSLPVHATGEALAAHFVPDDHWPGHLGQFRVEARFAAEGLGSKQGSLAFYLTPAQRLPGRLSGEFADRLSPDGDLIVDVGLEVGVPGRYRVEGNLFDRNGEPVAWARFEGELASGAQTAPLRYYGLVLQDAEAEPPFVLRDVRGYRMRPGDAPDREDLPTLEDEYRSQGDYALGDFRSDEYESPHKQRMLDRYRDALARGVRLTEPDLAGVNR